MGQRVTQGTVRYDWASVEAMWPAINPAGTVCSLNPQGTFQPYFVDTGSSGYGGDPDDPVFVSYCYRTTNNSYLGNAEQQVSKRCLSLQYFVAVPQTPTPQLADSGQSCPVCSNGRDPVNPATGGEYLTETDIAAIGARNPLKFNRYYNSLDIRTGDLNSNWRHSYSRRLTLEYSYPQVLPPSPDTSSLYSAQSSACTSGWAEIKNKVAGLQTATASFSNGVCTLSMGGSPVRTLAVYDNSGQYVNVTRTLVAAHATRDDGHILNLTPSGGSFTAEFGVSARLTATTNGYLLTDESDNVETYDGSGKLLNVVDRAGNVQTLSYNTSSGLLTGVADNFGHTLTLAYDSQNRLQTVTTPSGSYMTYGYDSSGRLSQITNLDGSTRQYLYSDSDWSTGLSSVIDENSQTEFSLNYDSRGRALTSTLGGVSSSLSFTYNSNGTTTETDPLGAVRTFASQQIGNHMLSSGITGAPCLSCGYHLVTTYDAGGFLASKTDYNNNVTQYTYDDARGLETSRTEAYGTAQARTLTSQWHSTYRLPTLISVYSGGTATGTPLNTTSFTYDTSGNLLTKTITDTSVTPNVSRTWTYTYDSYGHVLTANGPRTDVNDTTTYTYYNCTTGYQCGQLQTITDAAGHVTTFNTYNAHGQPLTITDQNNVVTTLVYDARQRLTSRTMGSEATAFEYWPTGLLKKVTLPDSSYLSYIYDAAHRLTEIDDGLGNRIVYTLDPMGNHTAENLYDPSSALVRTHSRVFNSLNQLWKDVNPAGTAAQTTVFGYDNNGNQTTINAPLTRNSINQYDELNRLKQITDPAGGITKYVYDANDNLTSVIDPRNLTTSYQYSGFGDLKQFTSPDTGATINTYDSAGNLATSTDARGKVATYSYDTLNRVTQIAYPDQTIGFIYDVGANAIGRLSSVSDASGSTSWTYTSLGRVLSKTQVMSGVSKTVSYGYNSAGQLTTLTTPSGQTVTYGYTNNQITSAAVNGTAVLSSVLYQPFGPTTGWTWGNGAYAVRTYDADGKVTQIDSAGLKTFGYDDAFRITSLTDAVDAANSWTFGYDVLDRLNSATSTPLSQTWTFDANGSRLTQGGTTSSTYTNATTSNQLTSSTGALTRTYSYDPAGHITSDGARTFSYNDAGRMISATASGGAGSYLYNALGQRVRKTANGATTYFVYDEAGGLIGEYDQSGTLLQELVWLNDIPVASIRTNVSGTGTGVFYIHTDQLNSPTKLTEPATNAIVWRWDHDPYGNGVANEDPDGNGATVKFNLRYPGQYFDQETGLSYNYFRDYDPATGRYVESDPIGLAGGINTYAYVDDEPLTFSDRIGLAPGDALELLRQLFPMPWDDERCKILKQKIANYDADIEKRYAEIRTNPNQLPQYAPGPNRNSINGHYREINKLDSQRRKLERDYDQHCNNQCPPSAPATEPNISTQTATGVSGMLLLIGGVLVTL